MEINAARLTPASSVSCYVVSRSFSFPSCMLSSYVNLCHNLAAN